MHWTRRTRIRRKRLSPVRTTAHPPDYSTGLSPVTYILSFPPVSGIGAGRLSRLSPVAKYSGFASLCGVGWQGGTRPPPPGDWDRAHTNGGAPRCGKAHCDPFSTVVASA